MAKPLFDLSIYADCMSVEAYTPSHKNGWPALHLSFGGSDTPLGIVVREMSGEQAKMIAAAVNAILDGHTVTINDEAQLGEREDEQ